MNKSGKYLVWTALSVLGAFALGYIALNRGEQINALWIVVASVCVYLIAYRFYGLYIAKKVLAVDPTRMTPAVRHNDGLDYVPTDKKVLFGHHFAAIAGAGPLVGPVLARPEDLRQQWPQNGDQKALSYRSGHNPDHHYDVPRASYALGQPPALFWRYRAHKNDTQ